MEDADIGFPHEITHIMKQAGFEPYLRLLEEAPDYVDFSNPQMRDILDAALKHISATFEELSDKYTVNRLYDELLSTVYGLAINGKTSGNTNFAGYVDFRNIFNDFDELFQRLKETHESFKARNGIPGIPSAGITSVLGPENMQLPAKQTPWQEYLEWYTRQIGELTRRQLSQPEVRETVWQRYLRQHEQDLWEHNRQRVKTNTEIGYLGGEQYGFGTEEGRTIREEPQVSRGLEESAGTLRAASTGGAGALSQRSGGIRKRSDSQWQDRLKSAAITPKKGSLEQVFTERAMAQYGLKANTLPANAFNAEFRRVNPDIKEEEIPCMFCAGGEIYIREGITEAELAIGLPHEANHAMGELGYEPYLAILKEAPDYLNIDYPGTLTVLDALLKHVNRQFEDLGDDEAINRLFDEALSVVYGKAVTGTLKGYGKLSNVDYGKLFNDFNELFQRLEEAHKGFEIWNKNRQNGKAGIEISDEDGGSVNSGDMETAQRIPAEQTPWQEYLEWYTRQIGELTRLRLSPPEERETIWQRYLHQQEKEREIEKALKTVEILGTVPEEFAELLEEAPGTDALVALRHWEDRRRKDN